MIGCVILTMATRPDELASAVASVRRQRNVEVDVLVVVNGGHLDGTPEGVRILELPENVGIAAGRNAGLDEVHGELVLFLDDDAVLVEDDTLVRAARRFADEPRLGVVSMRIVDPAGRPPQRRHVPRLRVGDPARSSEVTTFLGGASIVRREVFDDVGGFPPEFFYAHEEKSLAWRAIDAGFRIRYAGDLLVEHPAVAPTRHPDFHRLTMRNHVLLARRHLPLPWAVTYVLLWLVLGLVRGRGGAAVLVGLREGATMPGIPRRPIGWRAIWRMTLAGRPPLL